LKSFKKWLIANCLSIALQYSVKWIIAMFIVEGKKERKTLLTAFLFSIFFNGKRHYKKGRGVMILPCRWNVAVFSFFPTPSQPLFTLIRFLLCNDSNSNPNLLSYVSFCTFSKSSKKWSFEIDEAWGVVQKNLKCQRKKLLFLKFINTQTQIHVRCVVRRTPEMYCFI